VRGPLLANARGPSYPLQVEFFLFFFEYLPEGKLTLNRNLQVLNGS